MLRNPDTHLCSQDKVYAFRMWFFCWLNMVIYQILYHVGSWRPMRTGWLIRSSDVSFTKPFMNMWLQIFVRLDKSTILSWNQWVANAKQFHSCSMYCYWIHIQANVLQFDACQCIAISIHCDANAFQFHSYICNSFILICIHCNTIHIHDTFISGENV